MRQQQQQKRNDGIVIGKATATDDDDDEDAFYHHGNNNNIQQEQHDDNDDQQEQEDASSYRRPRKPNDDTIKYLISLPFDLTTSKQEMELFFEKINSDDKDNNKTKNNNKDEGSDDDDDNDNDIGLLSLLPESFIASYNVLNEIQKEIASIATCSNVNVSNVIETIIQITIPYSDICARIWLHSCTGYYIHLSTHRYGSHILQTILQQCCSYHSNYKNDKNDTNDLAELLYTNDDNELPSFIDLIIQCYNEIKPYINDLMIHICGSHVIRTLLLVMSGLEVIPTRFDTQQRGKIKPKKKKKRKNKIAIEKEQQQSNQQNHHSIRLLYQTNSRINEKDVHIKEAIYDFCKIILHDNDDDINQNNNALKDLTIHSSACPVIILTLYIVTYMEQISDPITSSSTTTWPSRLQQWEQFNTQTPNKHLGQVRPEPYYSLHSIAHRFVQRILDLHQYDDDNNKKKKKYELIHKSRHNDNNDDNHNYRDSFLYQLAGEPRGSHVLETIIRISPDSVYEQIIYHGSFFKSLDTLKEYIEDNQSNYIIQTLIHSIRTEHQLKFIFHHLFTFIQNGYLLNVHNKRRGILWRMVEIVSATTENTNISLTTNKFDDVFLQEIQRKIIDYIFKGFEVLFKDKNYKTSQEIDTTTNLSLVSWKMCLTELIHVTKKSLIENNNNEDEHDGNKPPAKLNNNHHIDNDHVQVDVAGIRTVAYLFQFHTKLLENTLLKGNFFQCLTSDEWESLAKDSLASRCIYDRIFEQCQLNKDNNNNSEHQLQTSSLLSLHNSIWNKLLKQMLSALSGRWTSLAIHRVGHHIVLKLFNLLGDDKSKERLVQDIIGTTTSTTAKSGHYNSSFNDSNNNNNRLSSNNIGRMVISELGIREYQSYGKEEWIQFINQTTTKVEIKNQADDFKFVKDNMTSTKKNELKRSYDQSNKNNEMMIQENHQTKNKTSSSKISSLKNDQQSIDHNINLIPEKDTEIGDDSDGISHKKKKKRKKKSKKETTAINDIFNAIPTSKKSNKV